MKIAHILFDGITFLDFVGFYEVMTNASRFEKTKDFSWDICGLHEEVTDEKGLTVKVNQIKPDLSKYDILFVPGGRGTRELRNNREFTEWLRGAKDAKYKISVCTGSLLLGAAGFLESKSATTHPKAHELLAPYCKNVLSTRIVRDGNVITGGGVATSIDLGLYTMGLFLDEQEVEQIKKQIDYPYTNVDIVEL